MDKYNDILPFLVFGIATLFIILLIALRDDVDKPATYKSGEAQTICIDGHTFVTTPYGITQLWVIFEDGRARPQQCTPIE